MFRRLLIANRGEIACRIIQTARRLNIATIAVYADIEKNARHVRLADQAVCIGSAAPEDSYLNMHRILAAAEATQADAIHPGYGFLSENDAFATACQAASLIFVGPSPEALRLMGSKQQAKARLSATAVPMIPGYHQADQSLPALQAAAKTIGFPLLIKAAAGGGGKGMRMVSRSEELPFAVDRVKHEALAYFNDEMLILEKFMPHARHVEVQIMGDHQGNILALFDRDCSVQRRHQKVIEEAPAPNLSHTFRKKLHQAACLVAQTIQYVGAGTIEFLVDVETEQFYFMEMNTRLQVEHPVTEAITGLDLVEWQLRIADHQPLPLSAAELRSEGHAFECRIYAEDPAHDFLPSTGSLAYIDLPDGPGIRIDTGYDQGDVLSPHYDALIAKLIVHGSTREQALHTLQQALKHTRIAGVKTNLTFLQNICAQPDFMHAKLSTQFLTEHPCLPTETAPPLSALLLCFAYQYLHSLPRDLLAKDCLGWTMQGLPRRWTQTVMYDHQPITGTIEVDTSGGYALILSWAKGDSTMRESGLKQHQGESTSSQREPEQHLTATYYCLAKAQPTMAQRESTQSPCASVQHLTVRWAKQHQGESGQCEAEQHLAGTVIALSTQQWVCFDEGRPYAFQRFHSATQTLSHPQHTAPMPGTIVSTLKKVNDAVEANDIILILEAMKMEHSIRAGSTGILDALLCQTGDTVTEGTLLFTIKEAHAIESSHSD